MCIPVFCQIYKHDVGCYIQNQLIISRAKTRLSRENIRFTSMICACTMGLWSHWYDCEHKWYLSKWVQCQKVRFPTAEHATQFNAPWFKRACQQLDPYGKTFDVLHETSYGWKWKARYFALMHCQNWPEVAKSHTVKTFTSGSRRLLFPQARITNICYLCALVSELCLHQCCIQSRIYLANPKLLNDKYSNYTTSKPVGQA